MTEIHAHIETYSSDCDGTYTRTHVMTLNDSERRMAGQPINDFHEIDFTNRVVGSVVNAYSLMQEGGLTVRNYNDGRVRLYWSEATEEGGIAKEATICRDDCDLTEDATYRDHRAESMGY
jgi:hypothetical protein